MRQKLQQLGWNLRSLARRPGGDLGPKVGVRSLPVVALLLTASLLGAPAPRHPAVGLASWYGEEHRGKLMANGEKFDPDKLTAASWFFPLGASVQVKLQSSSGRPRSIVVTITDRGPAQRLVRTGRIIDLSRAAFAHLASPKTGLVCVAVAACDNRP